MTLVRFDAVTLAFGEQTILKEADFAIESGERVCLIGRNGAGKSTTLRLITGQVEPDSGEIVPGAHLVVSQLEQTLPEALPQPVREVVRSGLADVERLLAEYRRLSQAELDRQGLAELESLHARIDAHDGWHVEQRVEEIVTELGLPGDKTMCGSSPRSKRSAWR